MKKFAKITTALLMVNLCFPYSAAENCSAVAEKTDNITVYSLQPTKDSVDGFYDMLDNADINSVYVEDRTLLNDRENCYWLRTISENPNNTSIEDLWMYLYKDSNTGATHLAVDEKVVRFIGDDGGLGVTSVALGDFNNDGAYEIYFTYSWNADMYCSQAGYFDTKTSEVYYFGDYVCPNSELVLTAENGVLTICKAELTEYADKVHIELEADDSIAEIVCNDGKIDIQPLSDEFVKPEEKLVPTEKSIPDWLPKSADEADAFIDEEYALTNNKIFIKDGYICCVVRDSVLSSYGSIWIHPSEKSDVKAPISYKIYGEEYGDKYIVACYEMTLNSYIEIWNGDYIEWNGTYVGNPDIVYTGVSDENGNIIEAVNGDVNKDGKVEIADLVILQKWLVGNIDSLGCWQLADTCDDNQINVFDLVMLKKLLIAFQKIEMNH